jgi:hypothetical protein
MAVTLVEAAQPIEHRGAARFRAVKPDRHLQVLFIRHRNSSMYLK